MAPPPLDLSNFENAKDSIVELNQKKSALQGDKLRNQERIDNLLQEVKKIDEENAVIERKISRINKKTKTLSSLEALTAKAKDLVSQLDYDSASDDNERQEQRRRRQQTGVADDDNNDDVIIVLPAKKRSHGDAIDLDRTIRRGSGMAVVPNEQESEDREENARKHRFKERRIDPNRPMDRQQLIKIISDVTSTEEGKNFSAPVTKLWPTLAADYTSKIPRPIDLGTMQKHLQCGFYRDLDHFRADIELLYSNACLYNGHGHLVELMAGRVRDALLAKIDLVSQLDDESTSDEEVQLPVKRQMIEAGASNGAGDNKVVLGHDWGHFELHKERNQGRGQDQAGQKPGLVQPQGPHPDELPLTSKKLISELVKIIKYVGRSKDGKNFRHPVDKLWPSFGRAWHERIANFVDLEMMQSRLKDKYYKTMKDLRADVHLLYINAHTFNGPNHVVTVAAKEVRDQLLNKFAHVPLE